jgi:hypothetical protein
MYQPAARALFWDERRPCDLRASGPSRARRRTATWEPLPMRTHLVVPAVAVLCLCPLSSPASALPDEVGHVDAPSIVSLGEVFEMCLFAPPSSTVVLLVSATPGSTPTKIGELGMGLPLLAMITFPMPASGEFCFPPDRNIPCYPELVNVTLYMQLAVMGIEPGLSNTEAVQIVDTASCGGPGSFATFTQGAWGATCNGNNIACKLVEHFDTLFPGGLVLGDPDGVDGDADGQYALVLTSASAVAAFLPEGSSRQAFDHDAVDTTTSEAGVLSGQLAAATLNLAFDSAGLFDEYKSQTAVLLTDLVFISAVHPLLVGRTVGEVVALANEAISGALPMPTDLDGDTVADVGFEDLSAALAVFNTNFDNSTVNEAHLALP